MDRVDDGVELTGVSVIEEPDSTTELSSDEDDGEALVDGLRGDVPQSPDGQGEDVDGER